ncbi:unnamed protein product [Moneuplotes crassus]|uniref:Uncharacterized protein n=1 Tax=Euplotes crassus TaxID=5936 RepID=A0AAD2D276_EUPCR|nr:unnamed protein product [Moneuplotes crassus]
MMQNCGGNFKQYAPPRSAGESNKAATFKKGKERRPDSRLYLRKITEQPKEPFGKSIGLNGYERFDSDKIDTRVGDGKEFETQRYCDGHDRPTTSNEKDHCHNQPTLSNRSRNHKSRENRGINFTLNSQMNHKRIKEETHENREKDNGCTYSQPTVHPRFQFPTNKLS